MKLIQKALDEAGDEIGLSYFAVTGGEPLIREALFDIFERYSDCTFLLYTNGTLLTDEKVKKIAAKWQCRGCVSFLFACFRRFSVVSTYSGLYHQLPESDSSAVMWGGKMRLSW